MMKNVIEIIQRKTETKSTEFKEWFDPHSKEGIAKLAKGCMAIYNANGGYLIVGIDNEGQVLAKNKDDELIQKFQQEYVQQIICKYSSEIFEISTVIVDFDDGCVVAISIPKGFERPAACKADLYNDEKKFLLKKNAVYARTYNTSYLVSSSEVQYKDWEEIIALVSENREQEFAKFLRRHFYMNQPNIEALTSAVGGGNSIEKELDIFTNRFSEHCKNVKIEFEKLGKLEFIAVIDSPGINTTPTSTMLSKILTSNPELTGWPLWCDSRNFRESIDRPVVIESSWRSFINTEASGFMRRHVDYWEIKENRIFYCGRIMQEDFAKGDAFFDPIIAIWRTLEAIAVIKQYAKQVISEHADATIKFGVKYSGLENRNVGAITYREYSDSYYGGKCLTNSKFVSLVFDVLSSRESELEIAQQLLKPIFSIFSGLEIDRTIFERCFNEMYERKRR